MKNNLPVLLFAILLALSVRAAEATNPDLGISAAAILTRTQVLSSDEFEGRAPGSAGEEKTVAYLIEEFKKLGLQPGNPDGTYIQNVPLVGITSDPQLTFTLDGQTLALENINEFVGPSSRVTPTVAARTPRWCLSATASLRRNTAGTITRAPT